MSDILVSVCVITYNHCNYIRQCLDGILMQQTSFPFEIIINDDCSTDGTTEIIKEYVEKYPDIIRPIYHEENQYAKGVRGMFANFCFPKARGKYIAMCEGDDYWTDPLKLQKQVDFLESNPEFVMCSHVVDIYKEEEHSQKRWGEQKAQEYDIRTLVYGHWLYHPLSVVFNFTALNLEKYRRYKSSKDMTLFYNILLSGKGYYMSDNMAIYRQHSEGVWSGATFSERLTSNYKYFVDLYEVEKSDLALAYLCEECIGHFGRIFMLKYWRIFYGVLIIYSNHYGVKEGLKLLYNKYLLGKDYYPWRK